MSDSPASLLLPDQIDDLGLALITLARELWVTKDRQIVLESMLQKKGLIDDVGSLQPDEALVAKLAEERTRFINALNAVLLRSANPSS
jgi:hypothetical protein